MRNTLMIGLAATSLLLGAQTCRAGSLVSLSTTAPDLNNLTVGQKLTLDVNLSGIGSPADNLDFLAATVKFDSSLLGTPTITPGSIVPDLSGFKSAATAGLADANYDALFAAGKPIASNGAFYSLEFCKLRRDCVKSRVRWIIPEDHPGRGRARVRTNRRHRMTIRNVDARPNRLFCGISRGIGTQSVVTTIL